MVAISVFFSSFPLLLMNGSQKKMAAVRDFYYIVKGNGCCPGL